MRIHDLQEAATANLYHSTRLYQAAKILEQGAFNLAASVGTNAEFAHQKPGKFYYLSTTRSKVGDYTLHNYHTDGVIFNLNGDWLNQRYSAAPVDYWERSWMRTGRTSEAEDRIYSNKPVIPLPDPATDLIQSIHVLYQREKIRKDDNSPRWLRKLLLSAKLKGVPIFVYSQPQPWLMQDRRKTVDLSTLIGQSEPTMPAPWPRVAKDYFKEWRELYHKTDINTLSPDGKRTMWQLQRDYHGDLTRSLAADIHNSKSKNDPALVKLLEIFRKLKINSPQEYVQYLKDKWIPKIKQM
jgi:hypothetical protein